MAYHNISLCLPHFYANCHTNLISVRAKLINNYLKYQKVF